MMGEVIDLSDSYCHTTTSGPDHLDAIRLMTGKYRQLVDTPPTGPVIILEIDQWLGWTARQLES